MEPERGALWAALAVVFALCLLVDLRFFARTREPSLRQAAWRSVAWLGLGLGVAGAVWLARHGEHAALYVSVYLIERSLSLDNVLVFGVLLSAFAIPPREQARLILLGVLAALVMRAIAIAAGLELLARVEFLVYPLGALLLLLAYRTAREPAGLGVTALPRPLRWLARGHGSEDGGGARTRVSACLVAIVAADLIFAVDSFPAAFAVTRDPLLVWMGNGFALLGLAALFVLVEQLRARLVYLRHAIAVVLAFVGLKMVSGGLVTVPPVVGLAVIAATITIGVMASLRAAPGGSYDA